MVTVASMGEKGKHQRMLTEESCDLVLFFQNKRAAVLEDPVGTALPVMGGALEVPGGG